MIAQSLLPELGIEFANTRKMLERIPEASYDWKPHEKSMTLIRLATHLATLPGWLTMTINSTELDFAKTPYTPPKFETTQALVDAFDKEVKGAIDALKGASDETLMQPWTLRNGEHIIFTMSRAAVIRSMVINHFIHHRGQLSVFLRLLDVPVPGMYGPSADEMN
jgi:uncharacterized damage-inducible protein DinB